LTDSVNIEKNGMGQVLHYNIRRLPELFFKSMIGAVIR